MADPGNKTAPSSVASGAAEGPVESPLALAERLLRVLGAEAEHEPDAASRTFCEQVARWRVELVRAADCGDLAQIGKTCLASCEEYLASTRRLRSEREQGFREVIGMLRESLATMASEGAHFNAGLVNTSERISALGDVEDIRLLKQHLAAEAGALKRVVAEKQRQDEMIQSWLLKRVETLEESLAAARQAATIDPLTRVANRGQLDQVLSQWIAMSGEGGRSFVLALIDVDGFKSINDAFGHPIGDRVLIGTAEILRAAVRPSDLVARYGGDEFALLLANMSLDQAQKRLPEVVTTIEATQYPGGRGGETVHVTISCGMTELCGQDDQDSILARADEALYAAKREGRNRAVARRAPRWRGILSMTSGGRRRTLA